MSGSRRDELIREISDGDIHSGAALAARFGQSRTAIWKQLHQLQALGLNVESLPGRGYRLVREIELLSSERIKAALDPQTVRVLKSLEIESVIDSTNDRLRESPSPAPGSMCALLAEFQTGGRGRRGRQWLSPFGSGICLSVNWRYETAPPGLSALGLASGVAVHRALTSVGAAGLKLKWPNDVVAGAGKLAGLLVDINGESTGPFTVIVGVGVNLEVSAELADKVSQMDGLPPVSLDTLFSGDRPSRNRVAAAIIGELRKALAEFAEFGFAGFVDECQQHDYLYDRQVTVQIGARTQSGLARGISADGALLLESGGRLESVISGEVTLRPDA